MTKQKDRRHVQAYIDQDDYAALQNMANDLERSIQSTIRFIIQGAVVHWHKESMPKKQSRQK